MGEWFDNYLDRARVRFVGWAVLAVGLAMLVVVFATSDRGRTYFGPALGADFGGFYAAGTVLNSAERDRLYELDYHNRVHHEILPNLKEDERLAFRYPPFVAVAFQPFARLPYEAAFAVWLVVSAGFYLGGLALLWKVRTHFPPSEAPMALLLALSFEPFLIECWLGGQLSSFAFFCVALAFFSEQKSRPFAAGLALGLLAYKPPLLALLGPMLLVGRNWRALAGIATTILALAVFSYLTVGEAVCRDSLEIMFGFLRSKAAGAEEVQSAEIVTVPLTKYVDVNAFVRLLPGLPWVAKIVIAAGIAIAALWFLLPLWWQWDRSDDSQHRLVWAATVAWTLVLNLYVGIYDATLAVFPALVTADVLWKPEANLPRQFRIWLVALYLVPWFTQPLAKATGVQAMTLVLMGFGAFLVAQAGSSSRTMEKPSESALEPQPPTVI